MLRDIVIIGDKIDIRPLDSSGELIKASKTYASQLLDIDDDKTISIAMPHNNGLMYILQKDVKYRIYFYSVKGLYQCNCVLEGIYKENKAIIASVRLLSAPEKIQRRQYYRLECVIETEYRLISDEERIMENKLATNNFINTEERAEIRRRLSRLDQTWNKSSITDLSGGGARFNSEELLKPGDRIRIKLDIITSGELKKLVLGAVVISSYKMENRNDKFEHRTEFYDIGKAEREDLIKYIFEQERRRRRNDKT